MFGLVVVIASLNDGEGGTLSSLNTSFNPGILAHVEHIVHSN